MKKEVFFNKVWNTLLNRIKFLIFLILFLNLISLVKASILLDDWVDDYETFKAGDHYFYVEYIESTQSLIFKMDNMGGVIPIGECDTRENIKYCFEDVDYPQIKVKITTLEPDISIEREFSTTTPNLNEEITVTVTLKNNGDKGATNVKYLDIYPVGLKLFSDINAGKWQGSLNAGEEEKFIYKIIAKDIISFDSQASISYNFGGKDKTVKSSTETIKVKKPFSVDYDLSKEAADISEVIDYNLIITNKHSSDKLKIENLEINIPSNTNLVKIPSELKKEDNKLTFTGTLEKEKSKNFTIKIKSPKVGKYTIKTIANLKISDISFKEEFEKTFNVGLSHIIPILDVPESVKSNSPYSIYIAVKNDGKEEIKNVNIEVKSDLFDNMSQKKDLAAGYTYEVFKKTLTSPYLDVEKKYNIKVLGSYSSSSGKLYEFEKSAQLTVTAAPEIMKIIKEFNKEEVLPGDEIKITVKVKNLKNKIVEQVDVSDIFPIEIRPSLQGDVIGYLDKLDPNEEKTLYSYSLIVPKNYTEDEIEFKTNANVKVDGELVILKREDKIKVVKEGKPAIEEEQETAAEEKPQEETNKTEEGFKETEKIKENFFKKIINWIKNLFRKK